ncbi:hypothetical protein SAMN05444506_11474 [Pseudomonas syringae]|uniref:hypothetical protein n=1 Tax=Pseudomonas syringae group TaxID=136849 RepID=UPI00089BE9AE|nr:MULTISPECIES: hypothetical protein [Pseudomonas syringae group]SDZ30660.1 hypothetical protein SAMN05444506_11474 [Pseudomonas syringae]
MAFQRYVNLSGQSNVVAYELGDSSITLEFASGRHRFYVYDYQSPGPEAVIELKRRAAAGRGLNSYVSSGRGMPYASKY